MWTLAYLDAGSGSMIASVVAGGAAGAAVMAKLVGRRVRDAMSFRKRPGDDADPGAPTAAATDDGAEGAGDPVVDEDRAGA